MDIDDLKQRIDRLTRDTDEAAQLIGDFPNLRRTAGPNLSLANIDFRSAEAKSNLQQDLSTLRNDTRNTSRRIALPVVVGFMGRYSSGKSTLLNAFLAHILGTDVADLPINLLRETSLEPTDTKFTYITHQDFADTFPQTDDVVVVTSDNPLFRQVNFIDTPGTGWKTLKFLGEEVSNLLSSADIMLFLFTPTDILDALSTEALNLKFTQYKDIPIWYIVTNAFRYRTKQSDWSTVDQKRFHAGLERAKGLLHIRECKTLEEVEARDRVWREVTFHVDENTFLVDSVDDYGVKELFARLLQHFSSPEVSEGKPNQIMREIQSQYRRLNGILGEAENHIHRLAKELQQALVESIKRDVATLQTTVIASGSARLSEEMLARLRQEPPAFGGPAVQFPVVVPASLTYVAPQVQILRTRLSEMHQERHSPTGILQDDEILFPTTMVLNHLERMNLDITHRIKDNLRVD